MELNYNGLTKERYFDLIMKPDKTEAEFAELCGKTIEQLREENRKRVEEMDILREKRAKEIQEERIKKADALLISRLGTIYSGKSFDNYKDTSGNVDKLKQLLNNSKSIYLFGGSRVGKTHLACGIVKHLACAKNPEGYDEAVLNFDICKCVSLDIIISDYRDDNRLQKIDRIKNNKILILDDIGVGKLTPERHSMYYYIIDHRICNGLQTIFTSNYKTVDLWSGSIDVEPTRLITRIREMCEGVEIK